MFTMPMMFTGQLPCAGMVTLSSTGDPFNQDNGSCGTSPPIIRTTFTLSGNLNTGAVVQARTSFNTSGTPSYGSWTNASSFSEGSSSGYHDYGHAVGGPHWSFVDQGNASYSYYFDIQFRLLGTDGTTPCGDSMDGNSQLNITLYDCNP